MPTNLIWTVRRIAWHRRATLAAALAKAGYAVTDSARLTISYRKCWLTVDHHNGTAHFHD